MPTARALLLGPVIGPLIGALVLAGCGTDEPSSAPADCTRVEGGAVTLVARNLEWDTDCLRVTVGTEVTFTVRNEDDGVKHDLEVYGNGIERMKTPLEAGPVTQTLKVTFPEAGTYSYVCTIHAQMEGDIFAEPSPP
jgi:plastocyanin